MVTSETALAADTELTEIQKHTTTYTRVIVPGSPFGESKTHDQNNVTFDERTMPSEPEVGSKRGVDPLQLSRSKSRREGAIATFLDQVA